MQIISNKQPSVISRKINPEIPNCFPIKQQNLPNLVSLNIRKNVILHY
jgi:hypothetical protein